MAKNMPFNHNLRNEWRYECNFFASTPVESRLVDITQGNVAISYISAVEMVDNETR